MDNFASPSVALFAGLAKDYSKNLCEKLADEYFIAELRKIKEGWNIALSLYWKNGFGYNSSRRWSF